MINNRKIVSFYIIIVLAIVIGCGPDNVEVWKAIPCKLNIIDCSSNRPNMIDIRMLNDDGSINSKIQFEQAIIEQNERKMRYRDNNF